MLQNRKAKSLIFFVINTLSPVLLNLGLFPMDLSFSQAFRMVHRRTERRRKEGCYRRVRNSHIYYAILSQVRSTYNHAGKLWNNCNTCEIIPLLHTNTSCE